MANTSANWLFIAPKASSPKRNSTPASIAAASAVGSCFISRSNAPLSPIAMIASPVSTNAPMISAIGRPLTPVISSAAPGVDQAVSTGIR